MFDDAKVTVYVTSAVLGAIGGVTCQLGNSPFKKMACFAETLRSSLCALLLTFFGMPFPWLAENPQILLGVSILVGLGGTKSIETVVNVGLDAISNVLRSAAESRFKNPNSEKRNPE